MWGAWFKFRNATKAKAFVAAISDIAAAKVADNVAIIAKTSESKLSRAEAVAKKHGGFKQMAWMHVTDLDRDILSGRLTARLASPSRKRRARTSGRSRHSRK